MQTTDRKCSAPSRNSLIDLAQFRQRQFAAQWDSLARKPEEPAQASGFCPVVLSLTWEERRRARRERQAWRLDLCASAAVVVMTMVFTLRVLL